MIKLYRASYSLLASIQYYFALVYHYLTSYEDSELLVEYMAKQAPTGVLPQFSIFTSKASFKEVPVERPAFELSAC